MDGSILHYRCPHCGNRFPVGDDSEEYIVPCPGCGQSLDLTELEPAGPETGGPPQESFAGLTIEETITEVRPGAAPDPTARAIDNAIRTASASAGNAAAAGLRAFRRIRSAFSQRKKATPPPLPPSPPPKPIVTLRAAGVQPKTNAGKPVISQAEVRPPLASAGHDDWATAMLDGRYVDAVFLARRISRKSELAECLQKVRRAASRGERNAMLALAGCLLKGIGCTPDEFSSQFWQSRANAGADEMTAVLRILDTPNHPF